MSEMISFSELQEFLFRDEEDNSQHVVVDITPWEAVLHGSRVGEYIVDEEDAANMGDCQVHNNFRHGGMNMISSDVSAFNNHLPSQSSVFVQKTLRDTAEYPKGNPLIPNERPTATISPVRSSSENPKGKRKRESVENKTLRQRAKILRDRADRLKKNADATINRLKLLCMQTHQENRDLLRQVNLLVFPLESDLNDIKDILAKGREGSLTDEEQNFLKEIERKLDNVSTNHSKLNSEVKKVETSLMQHKSASVDSMEHLKRELNSKFPELCKGETAIVEGQVKAEAPNIPMLLQGTVIDDSISPVSGAIKEMVDRELELLDSPLLVECEAIIKRAKEAGFQDEKAAETSLKNILSIYIAFKMIQK